MSGPGGSPIFLGVLQIFGGGVGLQIFGGFLQIFGGSPIFWGGVSSGIRSTFGRYASYSNAFLFKINSVINVWLFKSSSAVFENLSSSSVNNVLLLLLQFLTGIAGEEKINRHAYKYCHSNVRTYKSM